VINCIRKECIENPDDLYHYESHVCFVCGAEWDPDPSLICAKCGWIKCPKCNGCRCSLSEADKAWVDNVFATYCQSIEAMAGVKVGGLADTENPNVKAGLGMQLRFCRRWANEQLRKRQDGMP